MKTSLIHVGYTSSWGEGEIKTSALLNVNTGEITDIISSDDGAEYETLISETISIDGSEYAVETDGNGFDYFISKDELASFTESFVTNPKRKLNILEKIMKNSYMDSGEKINSTIPRHNHTYSTRKNGNVGDDVYGQEDYDHAEEMKKRILEFAPDDFSDKDIEIFTFDEWVSIVIRIRKV